MWVQKAPGNVTALAYAPDGRTLYTGDAGGRVLAWDVAARTSRTLFWATDAPRFGVYRMWPVAGGSRLLFRYGWNLLDALRPDAGPLLDCDDRCDLRYATPDGTRAISCTPNEYRVGLWDVDSGGPRPVPGQLGREQNVTHHDLMPDGVTLLTYQARGAQLRLWDFRTGEPVGELTPGGDGINPCALSADGTAFAVGQNASVWVYDVAARARRHRLKFEKDIRQLAFHPGGRLLASSSTDHVVTLWDATAGAEVRRYDWGLGKPQCLAFSPDGLTCAVGAGKRQFAVFDVDV